MVGTADRVMLVAAHWWDVHGAKRAGLRTCWIAHREGQLIETAAEPDLAVSEPGEIPDALDRSGMLATGVASAAVDEGHGTTARTEAG